MKLKDKVQHALDEARMLVLGIQVLLGFNLQSVFMQRWEALPASSRGLKLASIALLLVAFTLVIAPAARHRIVDEGKDTPRLHRFTRRVTAMALLPFALALSLDCYVVGTAVGGPALGLVIGIATGVVTASAWYVMPLLRRRRRRSHASEEPMEKTDLNDKIRHVLTEARVVLPGTQALLGFQFAAVLQSGFEQLPHSSKLLHVAVLLFLGASVIFLMLPAAYHRIAEDGEISERLHTFSSRCLVAAMVTLAVAVAGDAFIVFRKATGSLAASFLVAGAWLTLALGTWLGLMIVLRAKHRRAQPQAAEEPTTRGTTQPQRSFA